MSGATEFFKFSDLAVFILETGPKEMIKGKNTCMCIKMFMAISVEKRKNGKQLTCVLT